MQVFTAHIPASSTCQPAAVYDSCAFSARPKGDGRPSFDYAVIPSAKQPQRKNAAIENNGEWTQYGGLPI